MHEAGGSGYLEKGRDPSTTGGFGVTMPMALTLGWAMLAVAALALVVFIGRHNR